MLVLCYVIVAASFFVHVDPASSRRFFFPQLSDDFNFIYCCLLYNTRGNLGLQKISPTNMAKARGDPYISFRHQENGFEESSKLE